MQRRSVLRAAGALASLSATGCVGQEGVPNGGGGGGERLVLDQVRVEGGTELPLSVSATVTEPSLSAGPRLRIELLNDGDRDASLSTGAPPPFAVLTAEPAGEGQDEDGSDNPERYLLWTDAYRESDHVFTDGRRVTGGEDIGITEPVPAGERVGETYELVGGPLPGEYVVRASPGVSVDDGDDGTLSVRLDLRVE